MYDNEWTYKREGDTPLRRLRNCRIQIAAALLVKTIHIERCEELVQQNHKETAEEIIHILTKGIM